MEGLVLPVLLFALVCMVLALALGIVSACQAAWGAWRIRKLLQLELPPSHYTVLHQVSLTTGKDVLKIDHLVISVYGVFAIKQISEGGQISGKPADARWKRSSLRVKQTFSNPLFDCVNQIKALRAVLGLDASLLNFVLVFTGNVTFAHPMPVNVTRLDGLPLFIEGRDKLLIGFDELPILAERIRAARPRTGLLRDSIQPAPR